MVQSKNSKMSRKINLLTILVTALLLFTGCRDSELKRMPDTLPDIRGDITAISKADQNQKDNSVTILVEAPEDRKERVPEASIIVTEETKIEDSTGKSLSVDALRQGQEVEVWFGETIMESLPVQTDAIAIRIRNQE